jgi:hypothetical protein
MLNVIEVGPQTPPSIKRRSNFMGPHPGPGGIISGLWVCPATSSGFGFELRDTGLGEGRRRKSD